ncbi:hypothetical protein [Aureispira sp. CCB-QB1]|uniref:WD40/YVTN/BNR-like repeat-containing protein n=1 Tax=Aureispira sp. CCB-QB1 TaxID=1313421 RepID=UPI0006981B4A|nr:hypothetical protein [Aureispira sp. CCB-QB1]
MKQFFLVTALLCCYSQGFGQFQIHPDSSFYSFLDSFYYYHQEDSAEGGFFNQVRRNAIKWGARLYPSGDMRIANRAIIEYSKNYNNQNLINTSFAPTSSIQFPNNHPNAKGWKELGPRNPQSISGGPANKARGMGQMHRIAFHPDYGTSLQGNLNKTLYAGSHYGGLYRSDDGGANWYNFHTDQGLPITSVGGVAVTDDLVYVCTGNGDYGFSFGYKASYTPLNATLSSNPIHTQGVYRYNNATANEWEPINGSTLMIDGITNIPTLLDIFKEGGTMRNIIVHPDPSLSDNLLIATSHGIFKTENGGMSWRQVLIGPSNSIWDTEWKGLKYHPDSSNIVYASGKDIYESLDGGNTWTSKTNYLVDLSLPSTFEVSRINIAVTPAAPNNIYAQVVGKNINTGNGMARRIYLFDGSNWILKNTLNQGGYDHPDWLGIAVSPTNASDVFIGMIDNYRSQNFLSSSSSFYNINPSGGHNPAVHDDVHILAFPPNGMGDELFVGTHGGISHYDLTLNTWQALYNGLGVCTVWSFDDWEGNDSVIAIAKQDIGIDYTLDNGITWKAHRLIGDGYGVQIDDHSGLSFWRGNNYLGLVQIYPNYSTPLDVNPRLPIDPTEGLTSWVPTTFKIINHPKTDELYFGLTEMYIRNYLSRVEQNQGGGTSWAVKSNIGQFAHKQGQWRRQIMEIALSEDENTNNTYISTLNFNGVSGGGFRSGFFFSDQSTCSTCFVDKTSNLPISSNPAIPTTTSEPNPVTGIALDARDGNRVWVSFAGFDPVLKVWYSDNKGDANTWVNYDDANQSLAKLNVSINGIVYQRGTKDRVYIATDVGVYVREDGGDWLRFDSEGNPFPNTRTTELKINYCSGKLRAATFGRGVWEADLLPPETSIDYRSFRTITGTETWTTDKNMVRDIKVKAGATLILNSMTLNMPKDGLIVVEPGGLLVVDSSTITNQCGQTWQGIQVWGNSHLSQVPTNQGQIILSAATLEYAKNAISPWEVGNFPNPTNNTGGTGGIITAMNSQFINNWRSIDFMRYISPTGGKEGSTLHNCTFTVNDDYRPFDGDSLPNFLGHVSMWSVGGTEIQGCTFKDERSNKIGDPVTGGSFGLGGLGASPKVSRLLFPSKRNRFEGLERAVEMGGPRGTNYTTAIDECTFVDNEQAVIIRAHNQAVVIRDSFEIGNFASTSPNSYIVEHYGLGLIHTTAFNAEQNYFTSTTNNASATVGSWVEATGAAGNALKNNHYHNLTSGNLAHGRNSGVGPFSSGLQYHCNQNTGNDYDFMVFANIATDNTTASISSQQGSITQASRNTFSTAVQSLPTQAHFYNYNYDAASAQLGAPVQYYYTSNNTNEIPDVALLFNTNRQVASQGILSFCAANYTGTGTFKVSNGEGEIISLEALKEGYATDWGNYQQLKLEYDELPTEDSTTRSNKESELAGAYQKLFFGANQVIQHYANDSIPQNDSLETWIKKKPGIAAQYELVEHYWRQGRYADALDQIDYIAATFSMDFRASKNHSHYKDLKELLQAAYANGRMEANLEKSEVEALEAIADAQWGFAAVQASDILKFFYRKGTLYAPSLPNLNPVEGKFVPAKGSRLASFAKEPTLAGTPNPAINWVDLSYELPEGLEKGQLVVTSTTGARMTQVALRNNVGQLTLNTKEWVSGIYFATLFCEGQEAKVFKIVIQK